MYPINHSHVQVHSACTHQMVDAQYRHQVSLFALRSDYEDDLINRTLELFQLIFKRRNLAI